MLRKPILKAAAHPAASVTALPMLAALAILAVSGAVQYADEPGQVTVLNPKSYPLVGGHWTVDLDLSSGGNLAVAAVDGTYFGDDIGFARMYGQGGADVQPSYRDDGTVRFDGIAAGSWHFEVAVYTAGGHDMVFELGSSTARASNNALMPGAFVTTWQTTSAGETITIPISIHSGSYTVAWGDGSVTTHTSHATHTYASAGNHTVSISGDDLTMRLDSDINNAAKLVSIDQWGDVQWKSMHRAFYRASNMVYSATDAPDLSGVTDMSYMFAGASAFDGDLSGWDVSGVRKMPGMFWEAPSFNGNVSTWDVSGVTDMYNMFNGASKFNGDLSEWDVSRVTNMGSTFARAPVFDSDLSDWDVSRVKSMNGMFKSANAFNSDLSAWDVSGVTDMERLFSFAYVFDGDISAWDVSSVTDMGYMFNHADSFNGDISAWNVSGVTDMDSMFWENAVFNGNLSAWDVSGVTNMEFMFALAPVFNGNLSAWNVSSVTDMERMFSNAQSFNGDISAWDVYSVESMYGMFSNAQSFNGDISAWDVSSVTDMERMFSAAFDFEQNLGNWYIVLNNTSINTDDAPGIVGTISAQNRYLDNQNPTYGIGAGGDAGSFEITDGSSLNMTVSPTKSLYAVNITSTGSFGTSSHRVYNITVPAAPTNPVPAASFGNGDRVDGVSEIFDELSSPYYITTVKIGSGTYALVTSHGRTGGVQIIDITDPANPVPAASFGNGDRVDGVSEIFDELSRPYHITTVKIGSGTYALVTSHGRTGGVQIIDITDPANPVPAASFDDGDTVTVNGASKTFDKLGGAFGMATATIGSGTYALATAYFDHGVQIINITDPANPVPAASFGNNDTVTVDGTSKTFDKLKGGEGIAIATIGSGTYALVAAYYSHGVQIIDITDPANPVPAASFGDGDRVDGVSKIFDELRGANSITTVTIGPDTYALVTAYLDDGVQIINITDPANPIPAASFDDGTTVAGKTFDKLDGASSIATATIGPGTYALVAAVHDSGVQIIDITDPVNPVPAASVGQGDSFDGKTFDKLTAPRGIATATIDANAYALVAAYIGAGVQIIDLGETPDTTAPPPDGSFVTAWQTTSAGETITIPVNNAMGIYTVHWGDGSATTHESDAAHTYAAAGNHTVSISGDVTRMYLADDSDNAAKLVSIDQWGDVRWESMNGAFYGASNMVYSATDAPDLSGVTDMSRMFGSASSFGGDLSAWDVSSVTDMSGMFNGASSFDGDLSAWDVSSVADTSGMFNGAINFNQDLSAWNVSSVTDMGGMFNGAISFNQDLSAWNVSSVTDMSGMFNGASAFRQNLGNWYVALDSTVIHADDAPGIVGTISAQNQYLDNQNPAYRLVAGGDADSFEITGGSSLNMTVPPDKSLYTVTIASTGSFGTSNHRVYNVTATNLNTAFSQSPDGPFATTWKTTSAGETITIPVGNAAGNYTVHWGDGSVTTHRSDATHAYAAAGNHAVRISGDFTRIYLADDPDNAAKLVSIDQWGDVRWESMNGAFRGASNMIYNATDVPDLSRVWDVSSMFRNAASFDGDLSAWDVSGVTYMYGMFYAAASFDSDLSAWDVSGVTSMGSMFRDAASFDSDLSAWDVSDVTYMYGMFFGASKFNGDLSAWNVLGVTDMHSMFRGAASFDSDLSAWNVSSTTTMGSMFADASAFRQNLGNWYVELDGTVIHADDAPGIVGAISAQNRYLDNQNPAYGIGAGGDADSFEITGGSSLNMTVSPTKSLYAVNITSTGSFGTSNHRVYNITVTPSSANSQSPDGPFATTWKTTSAGETITIPVGNAAGNYTVHWGDGSVTTHRSDATHAYAAAGNHTVRISGDFTRIYLADDPDNAAKLVSIDQWGDVRWESMNGAFRGASNMIYNATDVPDLSGVRDVSSMFRNAASFDGDLSAWDVSGVTDMHSMFRGAASFDGDLSAWDVSGVTNMHSMFRGAASFDGDLSAWNVSGVTYMYNMFRDAASFDSDLSAWNVSDVINMHSMFTDATAFRQNLGNWYIVLDSMTIDYDGAPGIVGSISAQNSFLDGQNLVYGIGIGIGPGGDSDSFELNGSSLVLKAVPAKRTYAVNVTSTGDFGPGNSKMIEITVSGFNTLPTVDAGEDQTVRGGHTVTLSGTAADADDDTLTYSWTHDSALGITFADPAALSTTFAAPDVAANTTITVTLTVNDGTVDVSDALQVNITDSSNRPPVVGAGADQEAVEGATVTLSGTATDDDPEDTLAYRWTHDSALGITFADPAALSTTFAAPDVAANTTITVTLTVNDGTVDVSDALQVNITDSPNRPPVVEAGADQTVGEGGTVTLTGTATDADEDPMTYLWSQTAGSPTVVLTGSETLSPVFTAPPVPSDTEFAFELAASDGLNISNDTVKITVRNVPDSSGFVTTWQTTTADESITIPVGGASGTYTVDWGDGNTSVNVTGDQTHTYDDAGTYTVRISGDFTRIHLNGQQPNADKLQSIERWGDTRWESMGSAFHGASNVVYNATDIPVLSDVTTTGYMFYDAKFFSGDLSGWDVSRVTDMFGTFWGAESFSGDLSGWDVSRVTNMKKMLSGAKSFNADISGWDVSRVADMSGMFYGAESFNADISGWNVSSVTDMSSMFLNAESFNADISGWNVSSVTTMFATFMGAESFNADISNWDVSGVTNMHATFRNAESFNADISGWNVSGVTSMSDMFMDAASFNADISNWNVSGVTNMHTTFRNADSFNRDISAWDVSGVTNMNGMFYLADAFEQNLGNWYVALDSTVIHADDAPGIVGAISAQNQYLDNQNPAYGIGAGGDSDSFEITGGSSLNMTVSPTKSLYAVNITSTGSFGTSNYRVYNITVTPSSANSQSSDGSFATTWKTTSAGETITIPVGNAAGNYTVHWGDGSVTTHRSDATHAYAAAGNHTVRISGDFTRIYLTDDSDNAAKLVSIDQWGDVRWESMNGAFRGVSSMIYNATDMPDLSGALDASSMFRNAASFDGDLSAWDVSGVTNMHSMFRGAASFDSDLSAWDVSDVTYMYNMFRDATSFDGDLSAWDVSGVTSMSSMFRDAASFDGDLSAWDVSGVTDMHSMFRGAASFDSDLSEWDVSSITTMGSMFTDASAFGQNLGNWYVALDSTVIHADDAPGIVGTISAQNQYLDNQNPAYRLVAGGDSDSFVITGGSSLNMTVPPDKSLYTVTIASTGSFGTSNHRVYNVTATNLNTAFSQSPDGPFATTWKTTSAGEAITIPVGNAAGNYTVHWGDGNVTTHRSNATHAYAAAGNHTVRISGDFTRIYLADDSDNAAKLISIDQWGDVRWESMNGAFYGASNMIYNATDAPDLSRVTDMSFMFAGASAFDGNLSDWDVSRVTDMTGMFNRAPSFDGNLSAWDVSSVTDMTSMFGSASKFNGNLSAWDVSSVTHMNRMFGGAYNFDGNLSAWDVSNVESMNGMFGGASKFNGNLSAWDVSNVESMNGMFGSAYKFNGNLSAWDVSSVESMNDMFRGASSFNGNISAWDVSGVVGMTGMFFGASAFDGNLSAWDVSSATDIGGMFLDAAAFNGDLSSWDVSNVESMNGMFWRAFAFDGNLSSWDVSNVEYMRGMFFGASAFDGDLSDWDVSSVIDMDGMFNGAINFNQDLSAWDVSSVIYMDDMFTGASAFRQNLGNWYAVLDDTVIFNATETLAIRAQNSWLDSRNPTYGLGTGGDSDLFVITGSTLGRNSTVDYSGKTGYSVNITSTGDFGTGNHRVYDITVTGEDTIPDTAPTVTSIERGDPASQTTDSRTLVFKVTFSENVTGVDLSDFALSSGGTGTGNVTNLAGSGSQYLVNVSAAQDGTYNLDLVSSGHGITDAADNPLSSPTPTGADHTYTVSTIPADTTAPTVASIVRSDPAEATTSERTLVFGVTFSEDVTGVDQADFVLSSGGTGTGSVTSLAGSGSQYLVNVSAAQYGTYNLDIVPNSGITDTAGNPLAGGDPLVDQSFHVPSPAVVPELTTMPDRTVNELSVLAFVAGVTNGDLLVGPLTYGLDGGPAGAAMDPATGSFEWTPAETQNGGHTVTVTVSDSNGLTDSQDVAVTVNEVNTNPVLDEIPDQTVDISSTLTFVASATDGDRYPGVGVETVAANLQIPWSIDWIPDGAALFTERGGSLRIIRDGVLASDPLLSLSVSSGEGGLLGVAVDPDFGDNHYIYLYYSTRGTDNALINKVVRYQFANGTVTEDRVLMDGIPGAQYHDGGRIQFGPDGKLYITTGDAGHPTLAQDLDSLAGKILRIDRNGAVPADNPFVNSPVWSFGHRNPQGLDWDAAGNLVATEHGPSGERGRAHDEINLILPGANYGWPNVIGGEFEEGMREPILHTGSDTWAPSGAEFYDGDRIPGWTGKYFVAALRGVHLHMVDLDLPNNAVISNEKLFQDEFGRLRDVQTGPDGFLYLLTSNRDGRGSPVSTDDRILRIVPVPDADRSRPANTLTYGLDDGPGGASIDPVTGTFVWAPAGNRETGTVTFNVTVSDGRGGTDMQTVRVHVSGTITPQVPQTPRGIGEITLASTGPGVMEASWEAPTETPADYRIAWAKVGEPYLTWTDLSGNAFPTSPSQTVTGLEEGEQYKVKVRARYSSGGPGDWSGEFNVTVAGS